MIFVLASPTEGMALKVSKDETDTVNKGLITELG